MERAEETGGSQILAAWGWGRAAPGPPAELASTGSVSGALCELRARAAAAECPQGAAGRDSGSCCTGLRSCSPCRAPGPSGAWTALCCR